MKLLVAATLVKNKRDIMKTALISISMICVSLILIYFLVSREESKDVGIKIAPENISRIILYDKYGRDLIREISDENLISKFRLGINDAKRHYPNHPSYTHSWYLKLEGDKFVEFEFHLTSDFPKSVIIYSVLKQGNQTSYLGVYKSNSLKKWVDENLLNEEQ